ncbi:MAG: biopolymer transporter ExbD [Planctomycetes bacterium]|nr:biopolymer transporter ExbD [Planctomycetota bacterium]
MSRKQQVQEDVAPNLIPMIDIMFLLLLFFMLGADMGQRELEEVMLPKALAVKEEKESEKTEGEEKLVVNVYHLYDVECGSYGEDPVTKKLLTCRDASHWRIGIKGTDYPDRKKLEARLKVEGDRGRVGKMDKLSSGQQVPISERPVMIRADASAPYGQVQEVVNSCAKVGIYKIECGAARPPESEFQDTKKAGS